MDDPKLKLPNPEQLLEMLDKDFEKRFGRAEERWETLRAQSTSARASFNEKLAVLNAGSIALTGSAATILYSKPFQNPLANRGAFEVLCIAAVCLWLSLCLCVFHNLIEPYVLQREAKMHMSESLVLQQARRITHGFEAADDYLTANTFFNDLFTKASRLRRSQWFISTAAFLLFAVGYAAVVWGIIQVARQVR